MLIPTRQHQVEPMRLFYQSFGVSRGSRDGHYGHVLKRIVENAAAPGTEVVISGLSPHRAVADQYRYLELLDTVEVTENGLRAEKEGYDAFLVGNIFEPGLHELRELLNIPVLGLRESSIHVACMMGATFSLINVNPKFVPRIMEGVRLQGLTSRLVSVEKMTSKGRARSIWPTATKLQKPRSSGNSKMRRAARSTRVPKS
jgi:allantoin racemase